MGVEEEGKTVIKLGGLAGGSLLFCFLCFVVVYALFFAYDDGYDQRDVSYISETGDYPPQSTFFTCGLVVLAGAMMIGFPAVAFDATRRVALALPYASERGLAQLATFVACNRRSKIAAIGVVVGFVLVASFQEIHMQIPHSTGAAMMFAGSIWYQVEDVRMWRLRMALGLNTAPGPGSRGSWRRLCAWLHWLRSPMVVYRVRLLALATSALGAAILAVAIAVNRAINGRDSRTWALLATGFRRRLSLDK
ncbi:uncharacterized protein AMSG_01552 [Thecamonas trahens ATCC 50062]|uniref:CWH43-like N-terminal domain-containing protein n=1 Tax=Thecamonas trahens ATCC 50062 TaxID=461836 RepID=A0A0L0DQZ3_THETB|nr:hypothetical protein AMSG_01552 [Thecamonas trahens ATCC 50062]KNC54702.1 hypothetical protein AMSG_01552 [Thecamonas trahens ATCC 50062]|eukprot:XP_013761602.1 hypothetical protein AMSG_01552 [Thecamonas trahens ATCC 50062]